MGGLALVLNVFAAGVWLIAVIWEVIRLDGLASTGWVMVVTSFLLG